MLKYNPRHETRGFSSGLNRSAAPRGGLSRLARRLAAGLLVLLAVALGSALTAGKAHATVLWSADLTVGLHPSFQTITGYAQNYGSITDRTIMDGGNNWNVDWLAYRSSDSKILFKFSRSVLLNFNAFTLCVGSHSVSINGNQFTAEVSVSNFSWSVGDVVRVGLVRSPSTCASLRLGQVTGLSVTPGAGSLALSWTAVTGATGYKVQWKSGGESYNTTDRQASVTTTSHTIPNLTAGTTYTVRVAATKSGVADGAWSGEMTGVPTATTPPEALPPLRDDETEVWTGTLMAGQFGPCGGANAGTRGSDGGSLTPNTFQIETTTYSIWQLSWNGACGSNPAELLMGIRGGTLPGGPYKLHVGGTSYELESLGVTNQAHPTETFRNLTTTPVFVSGQTYNVRLVRTDLNRSTPGGALWSTTMTVADLAHGTGRGWHLLRGGSINPNTTTFQFRGGTVAVDSLAVRGNTLWLDMSSPSGANHVDLTGVSFVLSVGSQRFEFTGKATADYAFTSNVPELERRSAGCGLDLGGRDESRYDPRHDPRGAPPLRDDEAEIWTGRLTAGVRGTAGTGYFSPVSSGTLNPNSFSLGGTTYQISQLESSVAQLSFRLSGDLPGGAYRLYVGNTAYVLSRERTGRYFNSAGSNLFTDGHTYNVRLVSVGPPTLSIEAVKSQVSSNEQAQFRVRVSRTSHRNPLAYLKFDLRTGPEAGPGHHVWARAFSEGSDRGGLHVYAEIRGEPLVGRGDAHGECRRPIPGRARAVEQGAGRGVAGRRVHGGQSHDLHLGAGSDHRGRGPGDQGEGGAGGAVARRDGAAAHRRAGRLRRPRGARQADHAGRPKGGHAHVQDDRRRGGRAQRPGLGGDVVLALRA